MKRITSRDNPSYRRLVSLLSSAGIKKHGEFLLSGRKLVPEFLARGSQHKRSELNLKAIITAEIHVESLRQLLGATAEKSAKSLPVIILPKDLFAELDTHGTHFPLLLGAAPEIPAAQLSEPPHGLELILALANPLNLGAALRSAEAFSVEQVILLNECAYPFLPKTLRASSGSALRLSLRSGPSIKSLSAQDLSSTSSPTWALDKNGYDISKYKFPNDFRLLIGEEGLGIPDDFPKARRLSIPMKPDMDSLNAVAATSIALYAYRVQHS